MVKDLLRDTLVPKPVRRPQRILMTADCMGGVWNYSLDLATGLAPFGIDVVLALMGSRPATKQRAAAADISNLMLLESDYKIEWMDSPWPDVDAAGEWLVSLVSSFAPDLVHINGFSHASLPWHLPTIVVAHSCVRSWWAAVKGEPAPPCFDEYTRRVSKGLRQADLVIAPSNAMLSAIAEQYGLAVPSKVIPNGCIRLYRCPSKKKQFILTAGRLWDEAKNIRLLGRIAPQLKWPVYIAGDALHPSGTNRRFENLRPLGCLSEEQLVAILATAPIYVSPALYEPFGLTVLEAALSGCALVLSDIPSFRENWTDAAILVSPEDLRRWNDALASLIRSEDLRNDLSDRARERAHQLEPEKLGERYFKTYCELLAAAEPGDANPSPNTKAMPDKAPRPGSVMFARTQGEGGLKHGSGHMNNGVMRP